MGVFDQFYIKYSVINGIGLPFSKSLLGFYIHLVTHHAHKLFLGGWGILLDGRLIGFARFALIELLSFFLCLSLTFFFSKAEKSPFLSPSVIERESIHGYDDIRIESNGLYGWRTNQVCSIYLRHRSC